MWHNGLRKGTSVVDYIQGHRSVAAMFELHDIFLLCGQSVHKNDFVAHRLCPIVNTLEKTLILVEILTPNIATTSYLVLWHTRAITPMLSRQYSNLKCEQVIYMSQENLYNPVAYSVMWFSTSLVSQM